jgi:hypothetical protein
MATRSDTRLLEWCVKDGVNINHCEIVHGGYQGAHYRTTPALYYVVRFDFWTSSLWDPVAGLKLLLDRGAKLDFRPDDSAEKERQPRPECSSASLGYLPYLVGKWGVSSLLGIPKAREMIEFLTELQAQDGGITAAETLSCCETARGDRRTVYHLPKMNKKAEQEAMCAWKLPIKEIVLPAYQLSPTELLAQYIVYKGRCTEPVAHLTHATTDALLEAGADINARLADAEGGSTTLHQLCRDVGRFWTDSPSGSA